MIYNEWKKLDHVEKFIDDLDDNESAIVVMARMMKFCYDQGNIYGPMKNEGKYCEFCGPQALYKCMICGYDPQIRSR